VADGAADTTLDLTKLHVTRLDLQTAAADTRIRLPEAAGVTTISHEPPSRSGLFRRARQQCNQPCNSVAEDAVTDAPLPAGNVDEIDLIAIDIQRERDAGLGSLNQTRTALGLTAYRSFSALTDDAVLQRDLQSLYGSIDKVDLFIGGLAEAHVGNGRLGQTFQKIIGTQFQNLRTGDRFYWQNQRFDPHTASMISSTTLATILRRDTDSTHIQDHVFVPSGSGARRPGP